MSRGKLPFAWLKLVFSSEQRAVLRGFFVRVEWFSRHFTKCQTRPGPQAPLLLRFDTPLSQPIAIGSTLTLFLRSHSRLSHCFALTLHTHTVSRLCSADRRSTNEKLPCLCRALAQKMSGGHWNGSFPLIKKNDVLRRTK